MFDMRSAREMALKKVWYLDFLSEKEKSDFLDGNCQVRYFEYPPIDNYVIVDYTKRWGEYA